MNAAEIEAMRLAMSQAASKIAAAAAALTAFTKPDAKAEALAAERRAADRLRRDEEQRWANRARRKHPIGRERNDWPTT